MNVVLIKNVQKDLFKKKKNLKVIYLLNKNLINNFYLQFEKNSSKILYLSAE